MSENKGGRKRKEDVKEKLGEESGSRKRRWKGGRRGGREQNEKEIESVSVDKRLGRWVINNKKQGGGIPR